jgi:cytochrome c5
MACHVAGVAGAPKLGDKAAWAPRIATGIDAMTASVVKGKGAMPPKGGSSASEAELRAAVEYMTAAAQ